MASKQTPNMRHRSSRRIDEGHQVGTPLLLCSHALDATRLRYFARSLLRAQRCGSPWPLGRREQASNKSRGYPQAQAIYDGPHPGAHRESPLLGHRCRKLLLQVPPVLGLTQAGAPGCDDDLYADYGGGSNDDCVVSVAADSVATSAVAIQTNDCKQQQD